MLYVAAMCITESQNCSNWKRPFKIIKTNPLLKHFPKAGLTGSHSDGSWMTPEKETPQSFWCIFVLFLYILSLTRENSGWPGKKDQHLCTFSLQEAIEAKKMQRKRSNYSLLGPQAPRSLDKAGIVFFKDFRKQTEASLHFMNIRPESVPRGRCTFHCRHSYMYMQCWLG